MWIQYILGRTGSGKTHLMLKQLKQCLDRGENRPLIWIVPEQFTLQAERNLVEKLSLPGLLNIEVLSFKRLAYKVLREAGGLTRIHINEQGKNMALRKIIDEGEEYLTIYKNASRQDGFIQMLGEFLCELKQNNIFPLDLFGRFKKLEQNDILYKKIHDIAYIYEQLNQYLEGRYVDTEDYMNLVIDKMEETAFLKEAVIWIDGFHTFTPQLYRMIEKLMLLSKGIHISFPFDFSGKDKEGDLFRIPQNAYETIRDIAMRYGVPNQTIELDWENQHFKNDPELRHIQKHLYAYPYQIYEEKVRNVHIFEALNPYTEVEHVAIQIISLVRERGYRWRDIAVVSNDLESYGSFIERAFDEYGIPYFMDQKRTVMHNPIVEFVLSSLAAVHKGYRYEEMFRVFKTGFGGIGAEECERLENYILRCGIQGQRWKELFVSDRDEEQEWLDALNESKSKIMEAFEQLEKGVRGKKTVEGITRSLYDFLDKMQLQKQLENWIDCLREKRQYEYVYENAQIWNILMEMLDQLVEILGNQMMTLKEYIRILEAGFLSLEIAIIPTAMDQVLVGNIQRSKSQDIKALFVIGVNDGVLPSARKEEGILSDEDRLLLIEEGLELSYDREREVCEEKFMIYSALSKPREYLWLSYAVADGEGKAMRRSILIERLLRLFPKLNVQSDIVYPAEDEKKLISMPRSTFKYLIENLGRAVEGEPIEEIWWNVYGWYYNKKEWDAKRRMVLDGLFHDNRVDSIHAADAKKIYPAPIRASISRMELFSRCPFAHFIQYGLGPKQREVFQIHAPDMGQIFHRCIELFAKRLEAENIIWNDLEREQCEQIFDQIVDEVAPGHKDGVLLSTYRYRYLINRIKRIGKRSVWTLTEHMQRGGFKLLGNEIRFGIGQPYPPIEIALPDGETVYLEGRIDRVDVLEDDENAYVKIIDYKSGNTDFRLSDAYYGLKIQLMVYLEAVLNHQSRQTSKKVKPAGIFYFKIDDPMIKTEKDLIEEIEKEIRKELKMKGLVLKDTRIVRCIDSEIEGHSEILPVGLGKEDKFYSGSSVATDVEFSILLEHVHNLLQERIHQMLHGNIAIRPVKIAKRKACDFCDYHPICQFDTILEGNRYRNLKMLSDEEVMERIRMHSEGR